MSNSGYRKKSCFFTAAVIAISLFAAQAVANETDAFGVYAQGKDGYISAQGLESFYNFAFDASARLMTLPSLERDDETLNLLIHHPDFHPSGLAIDIRPVDRAAAQGSAEFTVSPLGDDRYEVTLNSPASDGQVVLIALGCCYADIHAIMLGDAFEAVNAAFAQGTDHNPASAEQAVGRISRAVPDNAELAVLHEYWQTRLAQRDASRQFEFVETVWGRYENAESSDERIDALQHVKSVTQSFLEQNPLALESERERAKSMYQQAKQRLDI